MFWEDVHRSGLLSVGKENGRRQFSPIRIYFRSAANRSRKAGIKLKNGGAHTGTAICHAGLHLPSSIS
jgi:hypothetical protein